MKESELNEGSLFEIGDKALECVHCGSQRFIHSESLSELAGLSGMHLKARPGHLNILSCAGCGHVTLFDAKVAALNEILECCECGASIPFQSNSCAKCGWTYNKIEGEP